MSLSQQTVGRIIEAVRKDKVAVERINSLLRHIPLLGDAAGPVRNFGMAMGLTYLDYGARLSEGKFGVSLGNDWNPFDPNVTGSVGYELQCTGIAEAACAAIMRAKTQLPAVKQAVLRSRTASYDHAGVGVETTDGGDYVIDWWVTLDAANPYVFRFSDWDAANADQGIAYSDFRGFP